MKLHKLIGATGVLLIAGCGSADREAALIGRWKVSSTAATMGGIKAADETRSTQTGRLAAQVYGAMALDINQDKTFRLTIVQNAMQGTWSLDKDSGKVTLNLTSAGKAFASPTQPQGGAANQPTMAWMAKLDDDNTRLRLQMGGSNAEDASGSSGGASVPFTNSIPFMKEGA